SASARFVAIAQPYRGRRGKVTCGSNTGVPRRSLGRHDSVLSSPCPPSPPDALQRLNRGQRYVLVLLRRSLAVRCHQCLADHVQSSPARRFVVVQIANAIGDQGDRFVVLLPEDRYLYRLAERLRKLVPMVTAKDSWRFHELRATVSQALAACRPLSSHRLPGAAAARSCAKTRPSQPGTPTGVFRRTRTRKSGA